MIKIISNARAYNLYYFKLSISDKRLKKRQYYIFLLYLATSIELSTVYIDENIDALSPSVDWNKYNIVKNEACHCKYLPVFL